MKLYETDLEVWTDDKAIDKKVSGYVTYMVRYIYIRIQPGGTPC